jgi:predicted nucleic acid-binding protein
MLGGSSHDRRHLGEAGSIQVALENGWIVALDDRDAVRYAAAIGVPAVGTIPILQACANDEQLTPDEAVSLLEEMIDVHGRRLPRLAAEFFLSP